MLLAAGATLAWWRGADVSGLLETGDVRRGEVWRLVTSALLHADALHLAFNLYWLWVLGTLVEQSFGHVRTALLLVFLAAASGAADFALAEGGVGLSGVGYGLFGMLWVLSRRDPRFAGAVDSGTVALFVTWFFLCIVGTYFGTMNVGNVAHGAGAAFGALVGWAVSLRATRRALVSAATAVLALACVAGAVVGRPYVNFSKDAAVDEAILGVEALDEDRNHDAVSWLSDSVRMNPHDADAWFNLGIAHHRLGQLDHALRAYRRAHEIAPNDPDFKVALENFAPPFPGEGPATMTTSSPADAD